jgi:excisionase family DNA binding protein
MSKPEYLNTASAGTLIGVYPEAIAHWIKQKGLPALRLPSRRYRIDREAFLGWLESKGCTREEILRGTSNV